MMDPAVEWLERDYHITMQLWKTGDDIDDVPIVASTQDTDDTFRRTMIDVMPDHWPGCPCWDSGRLANGNTGMTRSPYDKGDIW